ncbi:MAG: hypothetical protein ACE365_03660 [Gammaproteobacteria bacterium]
MATFYWSLSNGWDTLKTSFKTITKTLSNQDKIREELKNKLYRIQKSIETYSEDDIRFLLNISDNSDSSDNKFIDAFRKLLSADKQGSPQEQTELSKQKKLTKISMSLLGWLIGVCGSSAYYLVGLNSWAYFMHTYFNTISNGAINQLAAIIAFIAQASLSGWAVSGVFENATAYIIRYSEESEQGTTQKLTKKTALFIGAISLIKIFGAITAAIPRLEITADETTNLFLIWTGFFSVFSLSYVGLSKISPILSEFSFFQRNKTKADLLNTVDDLLGRIRNLDCQELNTIINTDLEAYNSQTVIS